MDHDTGITRHACQVGLNVNGTKLMRISNLEIFEIEDRMRDEGRPAVPIYLSKQHLELYSCVGRLHN